MYFFYFFYLSLLFQLFSIEMLQLSHLTVLLYFCKIIILMNNDTGNNVDKEYKDSGNDCNKKS